ncbi:MAG TPA: peptidoglycan-binding domain-containing protein [Candidatus Binatia bacterium]|nr:peptidoglycan-binding domain-containing protein [Candidatus Binatia bacterium]
MSFLRAPAVFVGLVLWSISPAYAQREVRDANENRREPSRFSDRDRTADWTRDKEAVERALKTGEGKEFYRRELEKMGFTLSAVNYDKSDYVEWEVVKGNNTYEVQIDMAGGKATKVDVTTNMWRADATKQALQGKKVAAAGKGDARFSDRDRRVGWNKGEEALERALKPGQDKNFYRKELEKMGYKITATNHDKPDYVEWEVVKGDDTYEVQLDMAGGKATKVDVATNMWQANATDRALDNKRADIRDNDRRSSLDRGAVRDHDDIRQVQQSLKKEGHDPGPIDGVMGEKTQHALREFQKSKNLKPTGRLDDETAKALGVSGKDFGKRS